MSGQDRAPTSHRERDGHGKVGEHANRLGFRYPVGSRPLSGLSSALVPPSTSARCLEMMNLFKAICDSTFLLLCLRFSREPSMFRSDELEKCGHFSLQERAD